MGTDVGAEGDVASAEQAASTTSYSGRASVLRAQVLALSAGLADTGPLPASGGTQGVNLVTASVPGLFSADALGSFVVGQNDHVFSQASAAHASLGVSVGNITVKADVIGSTAMASCSNGVPTLSGSATIVGLTINGKAITVTGAPNQTVNLLLGKVIINERSTQVNGASGAIHTAAIRVVVAGLADVSLVPAEAGLTCAAAPPPPPPPPSCTDAIRNAAETDVDCGGPACGGCENGKHCLVAGDCLSLLCQGNVCVAPPPPPTCTDAAMNGNETDVDCGGPTCSPCANGLHCVVNADCLSQTCESGLCVPPPPPAPTCTDAIQNAGETDVDCGGSACPACVNGLHCLVNADCLSQTCQGGVCVPPPPPAPTCNDGIENGEETGVDCGGKTCLPCAEGLGCNIDDDCATFHCSAGVCVPAPTCGDGIRNGGETDVDCGGPVCPACVDGKLCAQGADCAGGTCNAGGVCQVAPPCTARDFVSGQGYITSTPNPKKPRGNFSLYGEMGQGGPTGYLNYSDDGTSTHFQSSSITSYVVTGPHSRRITGQGTLRYQTPVFGFTLDVTDDGSGDVFTIALSNGYFATGTPASGDIQLTSDVCQ